jgi:hypothetical protein
LLDASGHYERLLGLLPDTTETRQWVSAIDLARMREVFGLSLPSDPTNADVVWESFELLLQSAEQIDPIRSGPSEYLGFGVAGFLEIGFRNYLQHAGFGLADLDQLVEAGVAPEMYSAALGRFDPDRSEELIQGCTECPSAASQHEYRDRTFYSWGEDFEINLAERLLPPAGDALGRGGRLAIDDDTVLRANWSAGIEGMIDAQLDGLSLAEDDDFALAARGLERLGTWTALITDDTQGPAGSAAADRAAEEASDVSEARVAWDPPRGVTVLQRYSVLAVGQGADGTGPFLGVVLVHSSESAAEGNLELLQRRLAEASSLLSGRPWSSHFAAISAVADGRLLLAKVYLRTGQISPGVSFVLGLDPLLLHE